MSPCWEREDFACWFLLPLVKVSPHRTLISLYSWVEDTCVGTYKTALEPRNVSSWILSKDILKCKQKDKSNVEEPGGLQSRGVAKSQIQLSNWTHNVDTRLFTSIFFTTAKNLEMTQLSNSWTYWVHWANHSKVILDYYMSIKKSDTLFITDK